MSVSFLIHRKVNSTFHFIPRLNVIKVLSHDTPPLPFHSVASREDNECNYSGVNGAHLFSEEKISSAEFSGKVQLPTETRPQPASTILLTHATDKAPSTQEGL